MNFKALNESELKKVSASNGGDDGGIEPPKAQSLFGAGGGDGVEQPKSMQSLTRVEMAKVTDTITGFTKSN